MSFQTPSDYVNPPPGSVLDHTVTRRDMFDFFLVSQSVKQVSSSLSDSNCSKSSELFIYLFLIAQYLVCVAQLCPVVKWC